MGDNKQVIEILKEKFSIKADYKLAELLEIDRSDLSRIRAGQQSDKFWRKIEEKLGAEVRERLKLQVSRPQTQTSDLSFLESMIQSKDETIKRQDEHIQDLRKTLEILQDQLKGGRTIAPSLLNGPILEKPVGIA